MIQPDYELDPERTIFDWIADDPSDFVSDAVRRLGVTKNGRFIIKVSGILAPAESAMESIYKTQAFLAGAVAAYEAFTACDMDERAYAAVEAKFAEQPDVINLMSEDPDAAATVLKEKASRGRLVHPEIRDHLDYIADYFTSIIKHPLSHSYVHLGGSFVVQRLDACYDSYMDMQAAKWFNVSDIKDINWQQLLQ